MIKKTLQFTFFIAIFWYLIRDIKIEKLFTVVESYSILGVFTTLFLIGFAYLILGYRWYLMTDKKCTLSSSSEAVIITGFLNMILPAKIGEISKILYLKRYYNYNINSSLALLFIERLFDSIILVLFLVVVNIFYIENREIQFILIILSFLIVIFFILLKRDTLFRFFKYIPFRLLSIFGRKIIRNINRQFRGDMLTGTILSTIALWIIYFLTYLIFFGFTINFDLTFYEVFIFFIISTIALAIPLTPGGVGTFQASIVFVGDMMGINKEDSLVAGIIMYLLIILADIILFYYVLIKKDIKIKDLVSIDLFKKPL